MILFPLENKSISYDRFYALYINVIILMRLYLFFENWKVLSLIIENRQ